jgi:hypothetical protein
LFDQVTQLITIDLPKIDVARGYDLTGKPIGRFPAWFPFTAGVFILSIFSRFGEAIEDGQ